MNKDTSNGYKVKLEMLINNTEHVGIAAAIQILANAILAILLQLEEKK